MAVQIIALNGTSSAGKTSIARCLQALLPDPWLTVGVDSLIEAMPPRMLKSADGITFAPDGQITVGPGVRALQVAWSQGVAAIARAGTGVILGLVLLNGVEGQRRWRSALAGLEVLWVAVRCDPLVTAAREAARRDRVTGMAAKQALLVHQGMVYDLEVDTTRTSAEDCARQIVDCLVSGSG